MSNKRDNGIILFVNAPVPEKTHPELKSVFGTERAIHINTDLLRNTYNICKHLNEAVLFLCYDRTIKYPDLTWLDPDDPGFLEAKSDTADKSISATFQLAFNTGVKKAVFLDYFSPDVKKEWLIQAFDFIDEKNIAVGLNTDGSVYLLGLSQQNLKIIEGLYFSSLAIGEDILEKSKKNKLSIHNLPETYSIKNEETLRKWLDTKESGMHLLARKVNDITQNSKNHHLPDEKKHHKKNISRPSSGTEPEI